MIKRTLGKTGYEVSAFAVGGFQFTNQFRVPPREADRMMDYAMEHGVNLIDTAQLYGSGESEAIIGRALERHPNEKLFVCTKTGHYERGIHMAWKENVIEVWQNYDEIMRTVEHTMWLLRVDHLDMMLLHEAEREWQMNFETGDCVAMKVLEDLKRQGVVKYIGASSWDCSALAKLINTGRMDVVMVAGGISLLDRHIFDELIPAAQKYDVGVIAGASLGQNMPGLVIKNREALTALQQSGDAKQMDLASKLSKLYDLSDEQGMSMVEMAIRYVLSWPEIHTQTMGARCMEHIVDNIKSAEKGALSPEIVKHINAIQDSTTTESYGFKEMTNVQREKHLFKG